jgi:thiamine monophosphate synthase
MALMETGIHGVAVSSGINMSNNKKDTLEKFRNSLRY